MKMRATVPIKLHLFDLRSGVYISLVLPVLFLHFFSLFFLLSVSSLVLTANFTYVRRTQQQHDGVYFECARDFLFIIKMLGAI